MTEKVREDKKTAQDAKKPEFIWNAGIYARLSVDTHDKKNESIETQFDIARKYIRKSENIALVDCYMDLGETGTNFQRKEFDRLMLDVRRHKINCIIVKDFSRFGRNYIETGNYIEKIFPFFNVRFISISDDYDSHRPQGENDILAVNLKNIVNELYARDCAQKVREVKKSKLKQGCFVGGIPSYGYCAKWVNGKKVLSPKKETSDIVRKVYELFDNGNSVGEIIAYLYEKRIHRPKDYQSYGHAFWEEGEVLRQWSDQTIRTILTNSVYIGALVQVKADGKRYRGKGRCNIEPDQVIIVEHTHEPIIEEDIFYRISSKMEEKRKKELERKKLPKDFQMEDIYKNLLYCGECGKKLKRTCTSNPKSYGVSVRTYSYGCPDIQRIDCLKCGNHFVSLNTINQIVLETLKKEFNLSEISVKALADFHKKQEERKEKQAEKKKREIKAHIQDLDIEMSSLYLQYKRGKIDKEVFLNLKKKREMEKSNFIKELSGQEEDLQRMRQEADEMHHFIRFLCTWAHKEICQQADGARCASREDESSPLGWEGKERTVLDGQILQSLMKKIMVYRDKRVEMIFNFCREGFR